MNRIWAVARNTIAQAMRMKIAAIFIVLLAVILPLMSLVISGDGTLKGKLQTFVSYGLSLTSLLLCLLTIIISTYTLSSEIKYKQIWTVATKPVKRHEILLGKLVGVLVLDGLLLFAFAAIIYGLTSLMPRLTKASEDDLMQVQNEFFTARASVKPEEPDVTEEVNLAYEQLKKENQLPEGMTHSQILEQLKVQKMLQRQGVAVGDGIGWQFNDVRVSDPNGYVFLRFKYEVSVTPPDLSVTGRWIVGDDRQLAQGSTNLKSQIYVIDRKDSIRTTHELAVPANAVVDGYLGVAFQNSPYNNTVVIFPTEEGLELLYKAGDFGANYSRAVLLIYARLAFLAILGISVSTWLSFPVAILLSLVVFAMSSISGFIIDSMTSVESQTAVLLYNLTIGQALNILPRFDFYNPTQYMIKGQLIQWSVLGWAIGSMVFIKGLIVWLLGVLIFKYRELAKITV